MLFLSTAPSASEQAEVVFVLETTIDVETLAQVAFNKEQVTVLSWYHTDESNQEASSDHQ